MTGIDAEIEAARALARASSVLERSSNELSLGHYRVLSAVASGHERASQVAAKLALGRPAVSAAVESLCERGLLTRSEVDEDHRAITLRLTSEGTELLGRVEGAATRPDRAGCGGSGSTWPGTGASCTSR